VQISLLPRVEEVEELAIELDQVMLDLWVLVILCLEVVEG
jgi:hypothetical protein